MTLYQQDLAYIQAAAYGGLARGAAPEIVRRLKAASVPIRKVVDVGCGAGPLSAALVQAGFQVTGIDSSAELLALARVAVPEAHFINASVYDAEITPCEAVIAIGESLTYHAEHHDADRLVRTLFQQVSRILPAGGLFVFDVIEPGEPPLAGRSWASGEDWAVLVETREDQRSRTLVREIDTFRRVDHLYRRAREIHRIHLFQSGALCAELAGCGFSTELAQMYGTQPLLSRRRAFFCTLLG